MSPLRHEWLMLMTELALHDLRTTEPGRRKLLWRLWLKHAFHGGVPNYYKTYWNLP